MITIPHDTQSVGAVTQKFLKVFERQIVVLYSQTGD
jgi:hypothetical protein